VRRTIDHPFGDQRIPDRRDAGEYAAMLHQIQQLSIERVMYAPVIDFHALMASGPRVTKHTFADVWMIKV
jgi:hypothetical protein